jgi:hypothetical protein
VQPGEDRIQIKKSGGVHASEHFEADNQRDVDDDTMMIMMNTAAEACMLCSRVANIC